MKNLKLLIITEDEKTSPLAAKFIAEVFSALKLNLNFYYIKSFEKALKDKNNILGGESYDLICLVSDPLSPVTVGFEQYLFDPDGNFLFLAQTSLWFGKEGRDELRLAFSFRRKSAAAGIKDNLKKYFADNKTLSYKTMPGWVINPVCVFSDISSHYNRKNCRLIEKLFDENKIIYANVNSTGRESSVIIRITIFEKDLEAVIGLIKNSNLNFWKNWASRYLTGFEVA